MTGTRKQDLVLQERDRHLLAERGRMRPIDRELAKVVAGFHSTTRANTRIRATRTSAASAVRATCLRPSREYR